MVYPDQMLLAIPVGWAADRHRRDTMLRIAAAIGVLAAGCLAVDLVFALPVWTLYIAAGLLGSYRGSYNAPVEAIFADSIPVGSRCSLCSGLLVFVLNAVQLPPPTVQCCALYHTATCRSQQRCPQASGVATDRESHVWQVWGYCHAF